MPNAPRRILFVCTANICRSPAAELIARAQFGEERAMFRSAGFLQPDQNISSDIGELMKARGIDPSAHRSYKIDEASINAAELILVMESAHLQRLTRIDRNSLRKALPITEAAALLSQMSAENVTIEDFLANLNTDRDPRIYLDKRWDVKDPYGGKPREYRTAVIEIDGLVQAVVSRLI